MGKKDLSELEVTDDLEEKTLVQLDVISDRSCTKL